MCLFIYFLLKYKGKMNSFITPAIVKNNPTIQSVLGKMMKAVKNDKWRIIIDQEKFYLFNENVFYKYWLNSKDQSGLINYMLVLEDIEEISKLANSIKEHLSGDSEVYLNPEKYFDDFFIDDY